MHIHNLKVHQQTKNTVYVYAIILISSEGRHQHAQSHTTHKRPKQRKDNKQNIVIEMKIKKIKKEKIYERRIYIA